MRKKGAFLVCMLIAALAFSVSATNKNEFPYGGEESCSQVGTVFVNGEYTPWFCSSDDDCLECVGLEHGSFAGDFVKCDSSSKAAGEHYPSCVKCEGFRQARGMGYGQGKCELACGSEKECDEFRIGEYGACGGPFVCNETCQCENSIEYGQKDQDFDGVPNDVDECPGTELFIEVDLNGCPPGKKEASLLNVMELVSLERKIVVNDKNLNPVVRLKLELIFYKEIGRGFRSDGKYMFNGGNSEIRIFIATLSDNGEFKPVSMNYYKYRSIPISDRKDSKYFYRIMDMNYLIEGGEIEYGKEYKFILQAKDEKGKYETKYVSSSFSFEKFDGADYSGTYCLDNSNCPDEFSCSESHCCPKGLLWNGEKKLCVQPSKGDKCGGGAKCQEGLYCSDEYCCGFGEIFGGASKACTPSRDPLIKVIPTITANPTVTIPSNRPFWLFNQRLIRINLGYNLILNRPISTKVSYNKDYVLNHLNGLIFQLLGNPQVADNVVVDKIRFRVVDEDNNEMTSFTGLRVNPDGVLDKRVEWAILLSERDLDPEKKYSVVVESMVDGEIIVHNRQTFKIKELDIAKVEQECVYISGHEDAKISVYYTGSHYDSQQEFMEDVRTSINGILSIEPFKSNSNKFKFSANSFIEGDDQVVNMLLDKCPHTFSMILSKKFFRSYATPGEKAYISKPFEESVRGNFDLNVNMMAVSIHEFGHVFAGLYDEYSEPRKGSRVGEPNCAPDKETARKWWGELEGIDADREDVKVGFYEGCISGKAIKPATWSVMSHPYVDNIDRFKSSKFGAVNERCILKLIQEGGSCSSKELAKYNGKVREKSYAISD